MREPDLTEFEHRELAGNGALLVWLAFRDLHMLRSVYIEQPKDRPADIDP